MSALMDTVKRGMPLEDLPFIDVHCHYGPWLGTSVPNAEDTALIIDTMDRYGCDLVWVCSSGAGWAEDFRKQNDLVFSFAAEYPRRILPYCTLSSLSPGELIIELKRCLQLGLCVGVKMHRAHQPEYTLKDAFLQPIFEILNDLRLVYMNHRLGNAGDLEWALKKYPDMCFLEGHGVFPDVNDLACIHSNLKMSTCGAQKYLEVEMEVQRLGRSDTMMLGSDFTIFHLGFGIGMVAYAEIDERDKYNIIGNNAIRLLEGANLAEHFELCQ